MKGTVGETYMIIRMIILSVCLQPVFDFHNPQAMMTVITISTANVPPNYIIRIDPASRSFNIRNGATYVEVHERPDCLALSVMVSCSTARLMTLRGA